MSFIVCVRFHLNLRTIYFRYHYYIRRFLLCQPFLTIFFYIFIMTIGDKIKELRLEKNLSQMQLAKQINVSQKAVDYWERNVNEPKSSYIILLVRFFDISFDDFFSDISI